MLERGGKVRAGVIADRKAKTMHPVLHGNVEAGSHIITDEHATYPFIAKDAYAHEIINHIEGYVRDHIHTNGIENFWSCAGCNRSRHPLHFYAATECKVMQPPVTTGSSH